ncbi:helix-turn-helix transcriptional regulator [Streptomyces sp. NPDC051133]|uniref:helix-turn-helix domain-containing protein n=1 Tax=Streptomyces sp. NPDC051133 TaxID=3155521 RepID=UPI00342E33D9
MASPPSPRWAPLPVGFGVMLRNARVDAGLSRDALATAVHASPGRLRALEAEQRPPSTALAVRLADTLQLDPWQAAVLLAVTVDEEQLRTRRGTRHVRRRGISVPTDVRARISAERAAGRSWHAIAAGLNTDGVPPMVRGAWWGTSVRNLFAQSPVPATGLSSQRSESSR